MHWNGENWEDETAGFAMMPIDEEGGRKMRDRTQTRRAREQDKPPNDDDIDYSFLEDEDDTDFGREDMPRKATKKESALDRARIAAPSIPKVEPPPTHITIKPLTDLKGVSASEVVGRRIRVMYEPEEPSDDGKLVPSIGLVTYYDERGRMHAVFDGEEEFEGLWVDAEDEWEWIAPDEPDAPQPPPMPVLGCWRPGFEAGDLDKIYLVRDTADDGSAASRGGVGFGAAHARARAGEFFVKWKGMAHIHCQWVPRADLEVDPINKRRVAKFLKDMAEAASDAPESGAGGVDGDDEPLDGAPLLVTSSGDDKDALEDAFSSEYTDVDRIIAERPSQVPGLPPEFLVKWCRINYAGATWEGCRALVNHQNAIRVFRERQRVPAPTEAAVALHAYRPPASHFRPLSESPAFRNDHRLRPHQLEGVNWLLFSYYHRRSVMLADEMGLGKTAQAIAMLDQLRTTESIRGPFLVIAPLSTLSHWQREIEAWTDMSVLHYHGSRADRDIMVAHEFRFERDAAPPTPKTAPMPPPPPRPPLRPPPRPSPSHAARGGNRALPMGGRRQMMPQMAAAPPPTLGPTVKVSVPLNHIDGTPLHISFDGTVYKLAVPPGATRGSDIHVRLPAKARPAPPPPQPAPGMFMFNNLGAGPPSLPASLPAPFAPPPAPVAPPPPPPDATSTSSNQSPPTGADGEGPEGGTSAQAAAAIAAAQAMLARLPGACLSHPSLSHGLAPPAPPAPPARAPQGGAPGRMPQGKAYLCGRCGQPKKGHTCPNPPPSQIARANMNDAAATERPTSGVDQGGPRDHNDPDALAVAAAAAATLAAGNAIAAAAAAAAAGSATVSSAPNHSVRAAPAAVDNTRTIQEAMHAVRRARLASDHGAMAPRDAAMDHGTSHPLGGGLALPAGWKYKQRKPPAGEEHVPQPFVWLDPKHHTFYTFERARDAIERYVDRQNQAGNPGPWARAAAAGACKRGDDPVPPVPPEPQVKHEPPDLTETTSPPDASLPTVDNTRSIQESMHAVRRARLALEQQGVQPRGGGGGVPPRRESAPRRLTAKELSQMHKFNVLLTTYEMVRDDPELFRSISWRVLVADEAHRLKNKDSAMAADLRSLRAEHTVMLSGTPLQNNTTELWALLSLLDPYALLVLKPELFTSLAPETPALESLLNVRVQGALP